MDKWQIMQNQVAENLTTISPLKRQSFAQLCLKRALMANIIAGVLQYLGLMLATLLLPPSLLWFSAGVAVGMVFLRGYKILPGIYLGSFAAYLWAGSGYIMAFWAASLHTLQPLVLVWLSRQTQCLSLIFYETRSFLKFVILSALVTAVISFLLAYSAIQGLSLQLWLLWRYWWLADFNGLIIFAIALVTWDGYLPELSFDLKKNLLPVCDFLFLCTMLIFFSVKHPLVDGSVISRHYCRHILLAYSVIRLARNSAGLLFARFIAKPGFNDQCAVIRPISCASIIAAGHCTVFNNYFFDKYE